MTALSVSRMMPALIVARSIMKEQDNFVSPEAIKAARDAADLSQPEAAAVVYVPASTWRNWEQGRNAMPPGLFELFMLKTGHYVVTSLDKNNVTVYLKTRKRVSISLKGVNK